MSAASEGFRAGFVAFLGRPNVGKSTLVNRLAGQKVAIVSPKPQTTRTRIQAVVNRPDAQVVLVDTPGFAPEADALRRILKRISRTAAADADVVLVLAEVHGEAPRLSQADLEVLEAARRGTGQVVLAINKIDQLPRKDMLLPWIDTFARAAGIDAVVPISALHGDGLDRLMGEIVGRLPESPPLFPPDIVTDQAERVLCAELVREQLLLQLHEEVPHSTAVLIDSFEDERDEAAEQRHGQPPPAAEALEKAGAPPEESEPDEASAGARERPRALCRIEGRIIVERESQKGIVVGKRGARIKAVSEAARLQMEELLGCRVYLRMVVRVEKDWRHSERAVLRLGYGGPEL